MAGLCSVVSAAVELQLDQVLTSVPVGTTRFYRNTKFIWVEYCPDNTCDVLRASAAVPSDKFIDLALAYYVYFSPYEYLKEWQRGLSAANVVDSRLKQSGHRSCQTLSGKQLAKCEMKASARESRLQVFFVRFDEGHKITKRISLEKALE